MLTLRPATPADQPLLEYWDQQPHVIASDPTGGWDWTRELSYAPSWREQLIAELNSRPIGIIQIIDPAEEETHYWGDIGPHKRAIDIWIGAAADLGKGYGTIMMQLALERCFSDAQVTEVLIDPLATNVAAIRFYKRLGFEFVERRVFEDDLCEVYTMRREQWNG